MGPTTPKSQKAAKQLLEAVAFASGPTGKHALELVAGGYAPAEVEAHLKLPLGTIQRHIFYAPAR